MKDGEHLTWNKISVPSASHFAEELTALLFISPAYKASNICTSECFAFAYILLYWQIFGTRVDIIRLGEKEFVVDDKVEIDGTNLYHRAYFLRATNFA